MEPLSNKKRFKTKLKSLNLFKSERKQSRSKDSSTISSTSTSTLNPPGGPSQTLTTEAESQRLTDHEPNPASQSFDSNVTSKSDAQVSLSEANFRLGGTTSESDVTIDARLQREVRIQSIPTSVTSNWNPESQSQSDASLEESPLRDVAVPDHQPPSDTAGRTAWNAARNIVGAVGQAADAFPPLKSVLGGITAILKTYDQIEGNKERSTSLLRRLESLKLSESDEVDSKEFRRRQKLGSALEPIQQELSRIAAQSLLARAANSVQDDEAVSSCVEDLRDALTDYQISLQQDLQRMGRESIATVHVLLLAQLPHAKDARYSSGNREKCLKGTRTDILEEIWAWAIDFSVARAYWLNGVAGSGKSTIAQTFAEWCFAEGMLGASFFCSRDSEDRSNIHLIFPTIAFQLAERYPAFREALISVISSNSDIGHESLTVQLERLLLEPLHLTGLSTVIIIDALDECKDEEATSSILSVMGRIVHEIPSVKIFITGRPEPRLRSGFRLPLFQSHTEVFRLHEVRPAIVDEDIRTYLRVRLPDAIRDRSDLEVSESWPDEKDVAALVLKCNGLFIFASTTYRLVKSADEDPRHLLKLVVDLADDTAHEGWMGIDGFYTSIMEQNLSPKRSNAAALVQLQTILGAITTVFNPLSLSTMAKLLGITISQIKTSLRHLHSVILVPDSISQTTKVYHKSFPDYLTDPGRCTNASFCVQLDVHHARMAVKCLKMMEKELKRNMCNLPRYATNQDVHDLSGLRERCISSALEYACQFWAHHLHSCLMAGEGPQSITRLLEKFFEGQLLSWLEVLSLAGELRVAIYSLAFLKEWLIKVVNAGSRLLDWVNDSERYVLYCFDNIQESASYIYESSVFWLPSSSLVQNYYMNHLKTRIKSRNGANPTWDRCTRTFQLTWGEIISAVFSDNSKFIAATGKWQDYATIGYLCVFDAATGIPVMTVKREDGYLHSAAFSPDCTLVFAKTQDDTFMSWDVQTGGLIRVYKGHKEGITSVTVSPSGISVASGSCDKSIRVWDVASGNCTSVLEGHTDAVSSVCWSPASDKILSGSYDNTVRLWDPATGLCLTTIEAHTSSVKSVAYSSDSSSFASASSDYTVNIYDARTNAILVHSNPILHSISTERDICSVSFGPCNNQVLYCAQSSSFIWDIEKEAVVARFEAAWTTCAAFSSTGTCVISGSYDGVLKLWQIHPETLERIIDPGDHPTMSKVTHIIHSPDGGLIVAGSADGTIRIWDATTNLCTDTLQGHSDAIRTLAFSPDAALLVSGSQDQTARVWDMREKRQLRVLEGHEYRLETVQFISDGKQIISRSIESSKLWDVETGQMLSTIDNGDTGGFYMRTDGVQIISNQDDSGSTNWKIQGCIFADSDPSSGSPVGFIAIQDRKRMYDGLPKPQHKYRYLLADNEILDQRHRTVSWSIRERKWVWSDEEPSASERFKVYNPTGTDRDPLNEEWVVDQNGRRILWMPEDRRGLSSNYGKQLAIALADGRVMTLDFTDV